MMWEKCADLVRARGGTVKMGTRLSQLKWDKATHCWQVQYDGAEKGTLEADDVILTSPLGHLSQFLSGEPATHPRAIEAKERLSKACSQLRYRDFLTVALIVKKRSEFDDNWIYIHDPGVRVGRIQNFRSWSPEMVPNPEHSCYGLEYFCQEGDPFWNTSDQDLIKLATRELISLGLAETGDILDGCVVRQEKAYPVYDHAYRAHVEEIRKSVEETFDGLHFVGRNGMHKYNNQDHSMMTAMLTVRNILADRPVFDVWHVNEDAEYHEAGTAGSENQSVSGLRQVPTRVATT
jgi:protoporphyrinogen oxidase